MRIAACAIQTKFQPNQFKELGEVDYFCSQEPDPFFAMWKIAILKRDNEIVSNFEYDAVVVAIGENTTFVFPSTIEGDVIYARSHVVHWPIDLRLDPRLFVANSITFDIIARFHHARSFIKPEDACFGRTDFLDERFFYYYNVMSGIRTEKLHVT